MKKLLYLLLAVGLIFSLGSGKAEALSLELSLVMDGSGSISSSDWTLQKQGYANAILDPNVLPHDSSVAINVIQFSLSAAEYVPFTVIDSQATAQSVANQINAISQMGFLTNISDGIFLGRDKLLAFSSDASRQVIDVSTDGFWNQGIDPLTAAMDVVNNDGITAVNAIGIGPSAVLGFSYGTDAFNMTAADFNDFQTVIKNKIKKEVTGGEIPEPATILLLGSGLMGAGFFRKRKRKKA